MGLPDHDGRSFAVTWRDGGLWRQRDLIEGFLGARLHRDVAGLRRRGAIRIGWGLKESGLRARRIAEATGSPVWLLEDGFLRSRRLGHLDPPLSIVVDDIGIYYDCSRPSRLERLIPRSLTPAEEAEAHQVITAWRQAGVSKYNFQPDYTGELPDDYVLVVDQTRNDHSIRHGGANERSFEVMLSAAISENPGREIIVKTHPDVLAGRRPGHFGPEIGKLSPRVRLIAEPVHPVGLIEHAAAVYTVTSQMGFEAVLWDRPVRTFGMPFYAGWGVTMDDRTAPERRTRATPAQLAHAALIEYGCYHILSEAAGVRRSALQIIDLLRRDLAGSDKRTDPKHPARGSLRETESGCGSW